MLAYKLSKLGISCGKLLQKRLNIGRILLYQLADLLKSRSVAELLEIGRDRASSQTTAATTTTTTSWCSSCLRSLGGCL